MLRKIFGAMFHFSEDMTKFTPLEIFMGIITLRPYAIIRARVLAEARKYEKEYGDRWEFAKKFAGPEMTGNFSDEVLMQIMDYVLRLPLEYAISVLDIMIYVNKTFWSEIVNEGLPALARHNPKALDLLTLHLVICCQNPDIAFQAPSPIREMLMQNMLDKFGINLRVNTKLPSSLLNAVAIILMALPLVGIVIFFKYLHFFFGSSLGYLCFFLMFLGSYWFERLAKYVSRLAYNKLQNEIYEK